MEFQWVTNDTSKDIVTLYPGNITLNKQASKNFSHVGYVLLGFDEKSNTLGIKPIEHDAISKQLYPKDQLHKISMGSSYARIANKTFILNIANKYNIDFDEVTSIKLNATFDVIQQILLVNLKEITL